MHLSGQRHGAAVRGPRRSLARACASVTVAVALLFVPSTSRGGEVATAATGAMPKGPTAAEREAHSALRDEMDQAARAGDWDLFLSKSGEALDKLPEHASSEGTRREVVGLVGKHEIDQRSEPQIERSLEILTAYQEQLRLAYGDAAKLRRGWDDAERYLGVLRRRLPDTARPPVAKPPRAAPPPASSPSSPADALAAPERSHRVGPLVVSGAVLTGVGGVLLIAGLATAADTRGKLLANESAVSDCNPAASTCPAASNALDAYHRSLRSTLGLAITGGVLLGVGVALLVVGIRKRRLSPAGATVVRGGVRIRF